MSGNFSNSKLKMANRDVEIKVCNDEIATSHLWKY
jgi:hypothetical protein